MKASRWAERGGYWNHTGGKERQNRPCKRSSSSSSVRLSVKHSGHITYKKQKDAASTSWKCSRKECLSVASQANCMAFYRWKVRVSWRCIYSYFRWVGYPFLLPPGQDGCLLRCCFFSCLKKACRLLQVILFPEGQAVELLQGHAENLHEVRRR